MNALFGVTWGDPLLYDAVLNADRLSVDSCVAQIRQMAALPEFQESDESRRILSRLALSARIRAALKANESTQDVDVQIDASNGRVVLSGIVLNDAQKADAGRVAGSVPGAGEIDNQLRLMQVNRRFTYSKT